MLSRALSSATVMLLIGCFAAIPVQAENLEAGKSPSQIFAGTCNACHKSPRGLLKTVSPGSLPGFLREHYTTSSNMAGVLSSFLISNGATDTRYQGKPGKEAKSDSKSDGSSEQVDRAGRRLRDVARPDTERLRPLPQEAARPDAEGISPQAEPGRRGRNARRQAGPGEVPGQSPAQAAIEPGPEGRKAGAGLRAGQRGKPGAEEPPKADGAKPDVARGDSQKSEPPKSEPEKDAPKAETAKAETAKDEGAKPETPGSAGEGKSYDRQALRPDPVPPVTPAPAAPSVSSTASAGPVSEPAVPVAAAPSEPPVPNQLAVTASAPLPPVAPAGPPAPPISQ